MLNTSNIFKAVANFRNLSQELAHHNSSLLPIIQVAFVGKIRESTKWKAKPNPRKKITVYLLKDVEKLGKKGEFHRVKPGYYRTVLIPEKLGINARIVDPFSPGNTAIALMEREKGITAMQDNFSLEERKQRSINIIEKILSKQTLRYTPNTHQFQVYPEDISCTYSELKLQVPRDCILELENGYNWPIIREGDYTYKIRVDPGVELTAYLQVLPPVIQVNTEI